MELKLLCLGDVVGRPGRQALAEQLGRFVQAHDVDCVIVNGENAAGGSGLTSSIHDKMLRYGVHLITLGDHVYRKREIISTLERSDRIVRPINLSPRASGKELAVYTTAKGADVAVLSVLGRMYMNTPTDNPFLAVDRVLSKLGDVRVIVVDVHAEASSEKVAMGWYLDGRVSVVFGTHTHVQTADERVLPKGTAYISDVGMTGPHESVLGRNIDPVLKSLTMQMPFPYSIATGDIRMNGILVTVDSHTGKASAVERVSLRHEGTDSKAYDSDDGQPDHRGV